MESRKRVLVGTGPERRPLELQSVPGSGLGLALVLALSRRWGVHLEPGWNETSFMVRLTWRLEGAAA